MNIAKRFRRIVRQPAFWIGLSLGAMAVVSNLATGQAQDGPAETSKDTAAVSLKLMREGTRIVNIKATCRSSVDRLVVDLGEGSQPLTALENLASQRILKSVLDDAADAVWIINGQITEFNDRNYILLDRVVREAKR